MISEERDRFIVELNKIPYIKAYPSQANFVLCELDGITSTELAEKLIKSDIFIKDCYGKRGINSRKYIRLSIRTRKENDILLKALKDVIREAKKDEVKRSI